MHLPAVDISRIITSLGVGILTVVPGTIVLTVIGYQTYKFIDDYRAKRKRDREPRVYSAENLAHEFAAKLAGLGVSTQGDLDIEHIGDFFLKLDLSTRILFLNVIRGANVQDHHPALLSHIPAHMGGLLPSGSLAVDHYHNTLIGAAHGSVPPQTSTVTRAGATVITFGYRATNAMPSPESGRTGNVPIRTFHPNPLTRPRELQLFYFFISNIV